ncbi:MAG: late competence development ComFB family protein [Clostridiales bacterium]|jgi:competence protein ComFB|nr:late competence development ComFB family protein [Clostridiales bacterium]
MAKTKKDIDKDLMYKMLMPSGSKTIKASLQEEQEVQQPSSEQTAQAAKLPKEEEAPSPHRAMMRRELGIPLMDTQQTVLVNTMEAVVLEKLEEALKRFQCCRCDRCKKDMVALALNRLSPHYMVLMEGQPAPQLDAQTNAAVVTAVIKAVLAVRSHPRH